MRSKRPSASLVLSIIAVVAACAGSATAATMITGASIKDASITGADIKNRSVARKDLKRGIALRGPQGPKGDTGATGAAGATGATGARGPSNAKIVTREVDFTLENATFCIGCAGPTPHGVTMTLGAGTYVAFGKIQADVSDGAYDRGIRCALTAPGATDEATADMGNVANNEASANGQTGDQQDASLTLQAAFTVPEGGASPTLKCTGTNIFGNGTITVRSARLTAVQVADLTAEEVTG